MAEKNIVINLTLIITSIFIGFTLCELGLRLYYYGSLSEPLPGIRLRQAHETLGWCLRPNMTGFNQTFDYTVRVSTNSKGLRDIEHDYKKENGVYRIIVLGDSFMEAYQVPLEQSFPRILEKKINNELSARVEVVNLGVGGYGTAQEYLYLKEEGLKYKPDLVILAFLSSNDVRNNSRTLEKKLWRGRNIFKIEGRPFFTKDDQGYLELHAPDFKTALIAGDKRDTELVKIRKERNYKDKLLLYQMVSKGLKRITEDVRYPTYEVNPLLGTYFHEYDKDWEEAWDITKRIIVATKKISKEAGASFLLFTVPSKFQVESDYYNKAMKLYLKKDPKLKVDLEKPDNILRKFSQENKIHYLSLLKKFRENYKKGDRKLYFSLQDRHWNKNGHELAADIIVNYVIENKFILSP